MGKLLTEADGAAIRQQLTSLNDESGRNAREHGRIRGNHHHLKQRVDALADDVAANTAALLLLSGLPAFVDDQLASVWAFLGALNQTQQVVLMGHLDQPSNIGMISTYGGIEVLATGQVIDTALATTGAADGGTGKIMVLPTAGTSPTGLIRITGTRIDRETGAETAGFAEDLALAGLGVDTSTTDAAGNPVHTLEGYLSTAWFKGAIVVSGVSPAVKCTCDIYHVSFEQFNDAQFAVIQTWDINVKTDSATQGELFAYLYRLDVDEVGAGCQVSLMTSLEIENADMKLNRYWRLRAGNIDEEIETIRSGVFAEIYPDRALQNDILDIEWKLWVQLSPEGEVPLPANAGDSFIPPVGPHDPREPTEEA